MCVEQKAGVFWVMEHLAPLVSTLVMSHPPFITPMLRFLVGVEAGWPVLQEYREHLTVNFYMKR